MHCFPVFLRKHEKIWFINLVHASSLNSPCSMLGWYSTLPHQRITGSHIQSLSVFTAMIKHHDQKHHSLERKVYCNSQSILHHWGVHGRNLEAGTKAEAIEEWCLLACSHGLLKLLSHISQTTCRVAQTEMGWAFSCLFTNLENTPQSCRSISSFKIPSSQYV